jgi:hypothetical protein
MPHVKMLVSGVCRIESDAIYFRKRASEERTAALHARHADARKRHLESAERYENRVRAIAVRENLSGQGALVSTAG